MSLRTISHSLSVPYLSPVRGLIAVMGGVFASMFPFAIFVNVHLSNPHKGEKERGEFINTLVFGWGMGDKNERGAKM